MQPLPKKLSLFIISILGFATGQLKAQEIHFADTIKEYNSARIHINHTGAYVIGGWGIANIAVGAIGLSVTKQDELRGFYFMDMLYGVIDAGRATGGIIQARGQGRRKLDYKGAYKDYAKDKKFYLVDMIVDVTVTGVGVAVVQINKPNTSHNSSTDIYRGIGKALVLQGVAHLAFDNIMYRAHLNYNSRWAQLLDEMRFTGNGIGFNYTFHTHHITDDTQ
jgi:hypothetical protein